MSTYKATPKSKTPRGTRTQTMDDFKHVIKILDIGISSELEMALQIEGIQSTSHLL